jgi:hypothetical protein
MSEQLPDESPSTQPESYASRMDFDEEVRDAVDFERVRDWIKEKYGEEVLNDVPVFIQDYYQTLGEIAARRDHVRKMGREVLADEAQKFLAKQAINTEGDTEQQT